MDPVTIAKLWLVVKPVKRVKEWRAQRRGAQVFKGKLTYSMAGGAAVVFIGQALGIELAQEEVASIIGGAMALVAIYGRYRATKAAK